MANAKHVREIQVVNGRDRGALTDAVNGKPAGTVDRRLRRLTSGAPVVLATTPVTAPSVDPASPSTEISAPAAAVSLPLLFAAAVDRR